MMQQDCTILLLPVWISYQLARTLLMYQADVIVRGHTFVESDAEEENALGPTLTELASDDRAMYYLLQAYQMPLKTHLLIDAVD